MKHLILKGGTLDFSDNLTGERFDYHLRNIGMISESICRYKIAAGSHCIF
ncbi:MAG: hypothetical protein ACI83B_001672 [Sediminicola sp.]|jgi:hypothetical protein